MIIKIYIELCFILNSVLDADHIPHDVSMVSELDEFHDCAEVKHYSLIFISYRITYTFSQQFPRPDIVLHFPISEVVQI